MANQPKSSTCRTLNTALIPEENKTLAYFVTVDYFNTGVLAGHQDCTWILCCDSIYTRWCHEIHTEFGGRRLGFETHLCPLVVRQNHFVHSHFKISWQPAGNMKWGSTDLQDGEHQGGRTLGITYLTWRGNCRGQRLGVREQAGVLGWLCVVWLGYSTGFPLGSGKGWGFSNLQRLPLWNERLGWCGHWGCLWLYHSPTLSSQDEFDLDGIDHMTSERLTANESRDIEIGQICWLFLLPQKKLVVLAVGIIFYVKCTTDILEVWCFSFFFLESTDKINICLLRVDTI